MSDERTTIGEHPVMTPAEVAARFGVSLQTVRDWTDRGRLAFFRTPGGQRRFHRADVERFIKDQEPAA